MDITTLFGLVFGVAAILIGNMLEGGHASSLFMPSALLIVIGGTIGATVMSCRGKELGALLPAASAAFRQRRDDRGELVESLVSFGQRARREGLLALEEEVRTLEDRFMAKGLQLVVDGADQELVKSILDTEIALYERHEHRVAAVFETAGGYAPTMGIIGTVMGLIHVLGNLSDADALGPAIAVAFLATFYGIASANLIFLPLASKLKAKTAQEVERRELILEGILSIQMGDNPNTTREKLQIFAGEARKKRPAKGMEAVGSGADA